MTCLLCNQPYQRKESFLDILTIKNATATICPSCYSQFEKIGLKYCPSCYRNGIAETCQDCFEWEQKGHKVRHESIFLYNEAMKEYFSKYKFQGDYKLGQVFSEEIKQALKKYNTYSMIPVPLSPQRFTERQFNQVTALLDATGIPYQNLLCRLEADKQSSRTKKERLASRSPFYLIEGENIPKDILVIDDVYTTGSTLAGIYKLLYENGAKNVKSFTLAR